MKRDFCYCCRSSRGVTRLDGARGTKQVWRPYVRIWGLSEANEHGIEESVCDVVGTSWRTPQRFGTAIAIRRPGNCAPLAPLITTLCSMGHFSYIVERAKRFVHAHMHCIVSNMESIRKISSFPTLGRFLRKPMLLTWIFFKFLAFFRHVLVVSYLQIKQTKNLWIIEILINHFFAIFKVSRPETFKTETETRPETFETETHKNGSRDKCRDRNQVSRLHHCKLTLMLTMCL